MKKIVEVNKKHIKKGKRDNATSCPVALALQDVGFRKVSVHSYGIAFKDFLTHPPSWRYVLAPRSVQRFTKRFDQGKKVEPFSFIFRGA